MSKLTKIQNALKAPKSKFNTFGNFHYRSLEDICEAVKPLLAEYKCTLTIKDTVEAFGDRVYVKALACLTDDEDATFEACATAYAREAENKKGMDEAQITGSASSYARKYALQGLFLLDDGSNDPDARDNTESKTTKTKSAKKSYSIDFDRIREECEMIDDLESLAAYYNQITAGNPSEKQLEAIKKIFAERKTKL